jgi:hypothetical protein
MRSKNAGVNKSLQATPVGAGSSAVAVHVIGPAWLSFGSLDRFARIKTKLLLVAAILGISVMQTLAEEPTGKIFAYGIFKLAEKQSIRTPETPSGITRIVDDRIAVVAITNRIPARLGVTFGIGYEISGLNLKDGDFVEISDVTTCPPIKKPDGSICESFTRVRKLRVQSGKAATFSGYGFDLDFEVVPGNWKMEIKLNGKSLITQDFTVYKE